MYDYFLLQVIILCTIFNSIIRDIRSLHVDKDRISTFRSRVEAFFQLFVVHAPHILLSKMPYLHYLRNHVPDLMELYMQLFNWGYGYMSTNAGEHLNKRIKQIEISQTNMDTNRFYTVIHIMRSKQFEFTNSVFPCKTTVKCSACGQEGHNKKNKSCPMHPSHPPITFDNSDGEGDDNFDEGES